MGLLVDQLASDRDEHVLIGYRLGRDRRHRRPGHPGDLRGRPRRAPGPGSPSAERSPGSARSGPSSRTTGSSRRSFPASTPSSVNLWGFQPAIWEVLDTAMANSGLDEEALARRRSPAGAEPPKAEVLLPEVVAAMVAERNRPTGAGRDHRRDADRCHPRCRLARW